MYNKARVTSPNLPLQILVVLVVYACNLVVHFVIEGFAPVNGVSTFEQAAQVGQALQVDEHSEEDVALPSQTCLQVEHPTPHLHCQVKTGTRSFSILPLLPPPNY